MWNVSSFSFIADKSLNVSDIKIFLIYARFVIKVDKECGFRGDILNFIPIQKVTEKELTNSLVIKVKGISINQINMKEELCFNYS